MAGGLKDEDEASMSSAARSSASGPDWIDYVRLVVFGGAALLAGIACAGWLDGRQIESLPGTLQSQSVTITADRPCRLAEILVHPGDDVLVGAPLVRLTDPVLAARIAQQRQELATRQAEIAKAEAAAEVELGWRRRELQTEEFETRMKLAALQNDRLNRQVEQIAWREHLAESPDWTGASSTDAFLRPITLSTATAGIERLQAVLKEDAAALAAESLTAQVALCEQRLKDLAALQERLQASLRLSAGVEVAERRAAAAEAELNALLEQESQLTIASPGVGVVGLLLKQPGDQLAAGEPLLELLDDAQRTVGVPVPSTQLGRFREGQTVTLLFPGHALREGILGPIPPQAIEGNAISELPLQIHPSGKLWPTVPIGTRVEVVAP